jgi:hypothetical protein
MVRWELTKFKVEKTVTDVLSSVLTFEAEIVIPETRKAIVVVYDGRQFTVGGSELGQDYFVYKIRPKLQSLLESGLFLELSRHSRKAEYLRGFSLRKISVYPGGTVANLRYVYNDKFLEFGSVLIIPPYKEWNKLCQIPLTVETNAVSNTKSFYEILEEICMSKIRVRVDVEDINEVLKIILQKIGV